MKLTFTRLMTAVTLLGVITMTAAAEDAQKPSPEATGYAIGQQFGNFLKGTEDLWDMKSLSEGMNDAISGKDPKFSGQELEAAFRAFQQSAMEAQQKLAAEEAQSVIVEGAKFLEENAKRKEITVLPSGLQYEVIEAGTGVKPAASDTVIAHYRGTFINGEEFDSSFSRGEPSEFPVTRVIPGWTEALQLMKVGAKWKLYIPYNLAYGDQGNPRIPGGSALLFDIELIGVK